jgi:hypothetical protein
MVTSQDAQSITKDFVKKRKNVEKVEIISAEQQEEVWVVKGACPIDVCGHPWMEKFEIVIDLKGRVKDSDFRLM